ncbi:MAG: dUTP diphosphatase [Candidatus Diapherotrites archaeon]
MTDVKVKKINSEAIIPEYVHEGDSGMDVYSVNDCELKPGGRELVRTGLVFEIPIGYEIQVRPRSGLAIKKGVTVLNAPGTVDSSYRGELGVILINHSNETYSVKKGERVAQIVLSQVEKMVLKEVGELSDTERGPGGFGHTGNK